MWKEISIGKSFITEEVINKRKDGIEYEVQLAISPVQKDGKILFYVGIEQNISERKSVERAKTEFVSLSSHQLRTPLSAINWYTEMLLDESIGTLNTNQKKYLQEIEWGNDRMVKLVNSLLNVSRLEMGTFTAESEDVELRSLFDDVLEEVRSAYRENIPEISTHFKEHISIHTDRNMLQIILHNLLTNAVKYTPGNGKIRVSIGKLSDTIIIKVKDSGCGIPAHQQQEIFTKLFRADNVRQLDTDGTGLGLYIVKSIIARMGGEISFVSQENKGTTFTVVLPLGVEFP